MPDNNVTFFGSWIPADAEIAVYSVHHYLVGGPVSPQLVEVELFFGIVGEYVTATPKTGYVGFSWDGNAAGREIEDTGGFTLELFYTVKNHTVSYEIQGDVPAGAPAVPPAANALYGDSVSVAQNLAFGSHIFSGWRTSDSRVDSGAFYMPDHDVAFVGSWLEPPKVYVVSFVDWDASLLKMDFVFPGSDATPPAEPLRDQHFFTGWDVGFTNINDHLTVTALYQAHSGPLFGNPPGLGGGNEGNQGEGFAENYDSPPATGDAMNITGWMTLMLISLLSLLGILYLQGAFGNTQQTLNSRRFR